MAAQFLANVTEAAAEVQKGTTFEVENNHELKWRTWFCEVKLLLLKWQTRVFKIPSFSSKISY